MNDQLDFVDSHLPIDFDPERDEAWPLPEPKPFKPALPPSWREIFGKLAERCGL
jgi:hypothetical protein